LTAVFQITQARLVRKLAHAADDGEALKSLVDDHCPATAAYARSCHADPYRSQLWRTTMVLHAINDVVGGIGVEGLGPGRNGDFAPPYEYVNRGDLYGMTLVYKRATDNLYLGCWGNIAEQHPTW
jgi:hypothetical protein